LIPGFNERALDLQAIYEQCERYGLVSRELRFRRYHGLSFHLEGVPFLYINTLVLPAERVIAGWHEFAHLMYHPDDACVFTSKGSLYRLSKAER
jgi:Zn-dependent peptidase ImmA (M78 family)